MICAKFLTDISHGVSVNILFHHLALSLPPVPIQTGLSLFTTSECVNLSMLLTLCKICYRLLLMTVYISNVL